MNIKLKILALAIASVYSYSAVASDGLYTEDSDDFDGGDEYFGDFYGDEEMIEIATGIKTQIHKAPAVASIITRADIESMGAITIDDVLESIPGLHVIPSASARLTPVYAIRGVQTGFNPQILVLMDGLEFKHPTSAGLTYGFKLPVNNVERIEVIRGPGSAIYGADAYSGVINIITKQAKGESQLNVGVMSGSFSSSNFWIDGNWMYDDFKVHVSGSRYESDGDDSRTISSDLQTRFDSLFNTSASLAPTSLPTQFEISNIHFDISWNNWQLKNWFWKLENGGSGNGATQTIDKVGTENADMSRSQLIYNKKLSNDWQVTAKASYYEIEADSYLVLFPAGAKIPVGDDGNIFTPNLDNIEGGGVVSFDQGVIGNPIPALTETRFSLVNVYDGLKSHNLRLELGGYNSRLSAKEYKNFGPGILDGELYSETAPEQLVDLSHSEHIYVQDQDRDVRYISIQDQWAFSNDWELTFGLRYDDYSDFGTTVNPRAALVWQTSYNLTSKLLYGSAFRAPSFSELYLINNPAALGNQNIKPEEMDTLELVFDYRPSIDSRVALNLFKYEASDLIVRVKDPEPKTSTTSQNARDQDGYGAEIEFEWMVNDKLTWAMNLAHQNSENMQTGEDVINVPKTQVYSDFRYKISNKLSFSTQLNWLLNRQRAQTDERAELDDNVLVNANLLYQVTENFKFKLIGKNIFDEDYREPSDGRIADDIPMESRSLYGMMEFQF